MKRIARNYSDAGERGRGFAVVAEEMSGHDRNEENYGNSR